MRASNFHRLPYWLPDFCRVFTKEPNDVPEEAIENFGTAPGQRNAMNLEPTLPKCNMESKNDRGPKGISWIR